MVAYKSMETIGILALGAIVSLGLACVWAGILIWRGHQTRYPRTLATLVILFGLQPALALLGIAAVTIVNNRDSTSLTLLIALATVSTAAVGMTIYLYRKRGGWNIKLLLLVLVGAVVPLGVFITMTYLGIQRGVKSAASVGPVEIQTEATKELTAPVFPWPPPRASTSIVLPSGLILHNNSSTLFGVNQIIGLALLRAGYVEKSYFAVPRGFALVCRLEQIELDGTPMPGRARWSIEALPMRKFSLSDYFSVLLDAPPGYYRVLVFVVTDEPFSQVDTRITGLEAEAWLSTGLNVLPKVIGELRYTPEYNCTVLVYEFQRSKTGPDVLVPGRLDGTTHLRKSGLYAALEKGH